MKLIPQHDYVRIRPMDPESTQGGIIIPDTAKDSVANRGELIHNWNYLCRGVVVAVGPGRKTTATRRTRSDVQPGDVVMYKRAEATDLPDNETVMVREQSIAYVEEDKS